MNLDETLTEIDKFCTWIKEKLDAEAEEWGRLKARKDHEKEKREIKLAELKLKFDGSDAYQTTQARAHPSWADFVDNMEDESAEYYTADYKKGFQEKFIDVLRSLLSYNKGRINDEI
jgi:hypothetical protein